MARTKWDPNFDQLMESLRAQGFAIRRSFDASSAVTVLKDEVAAVLIPTQEAVATMTEGPCAWIGGQLARLVDRGYQKFLVTDQYELPATAERLEAIHRFDQELRLWIGAASIYNEALGTTSDLSEYDRLNGRAGADDPLDYSAH